MEIFFDRPIPVRAVLSRLGQGSAIFTNFISTQTVDISIAVFDELNGVLVKLPEIVGRVIHPIVPVEAEPAHVALNGLLELHRLLARIRVVEAKVAKTFILSGDSKVQTDRLGMTNMQVAVRLGRESRMHTAAVLVRFDVFSDPLSNKVQRGRRF